MGNNENNNRTYGPDAHIQGNGVRKTPWLGRNIFPVLSFTLLVFCIALVALYLAGAINY